MFTPHARHAVRRHIIRMIIIAITLASGCGQATPTSAPSATPALATETTIPPTEISTPPTKTSAPPTMTPMPPPDTPTPQPTRIAPSPTLPPPTGRDLYRSGLIPAAQEALDRLPGASVYDVTLHIPDNSTLLRGHESVLYTNREEQALDVVYFRLFANTSGGTATVSQVHVDGVLVQPAYEFQNSALRVPLPEALEPDQSVTIHMDFEVHVPNEMGGNYGLLGYFDGVLALDEFYPVIAVYDDEGWSVGDPPPNGDITHLDASFYRVRVSAPVDLTLVASGVEIGREVEADEQTLTFAAGPARDFYLAASKDFVVFSKVVGETTVNSYAPLKWAEGAELALQFAVDALQSFSARFGVYPYTEFDIVSTRMGANGMEYPGMTALSFKLYDPQAQVYGLPSQTMLEYITVHEVAHQWFYNVVGNDQVDEPWLDEALAQYAVGLYFADVYGEEAAQNYRGSWDWIWSDASQADLPIGLPSGAYTQDDYQPIVYGRGPIFVMALAQDMGQAAFDAFMRDYCASHGWGISATDSFRQLAETHCQCDLTALFKEWVYEPTETSSPAPGAIANIMAGLQGLPLDEFFEASYTQLLLRDPQGLSSMGVAEKYGLRHDQLTDISDAYIRETQALEVAILNLLRAFDRSALSYEQQISYDVYEWHLEEQVRGHEFTHHRYWVNSFSLTGEQNRIVDFFTTEHPVMNAQNARDYVARLSKTDVKLDQLLEQVKLSAQAGVIPPRFVIEHSVEQMRGHLDMRSSDPASIRPESLALYTAFEEKLD